MRPGFLAIWQQGFKVWGREREPHRYCRAGALLAFGDDRASVLLHNRLSPGQADPFPLDPANDVAGAVKALEDRGEFSGRNAYALILDR